MELGDFDLYFSSLPFAFSFLFFFYRLLFFLLAHIRQTDRALGANLRIWQLACNITRSGNVALS